MDYSKLAAKLVFVTASAVSALEYIEYHVSSSDQWSWHWLVGATTALGVWWAGRR